MSNQIFQAPARARGCFRLPADRLEIEHKSHGALSLPQASKRAEKDECNNDQQANDDNNVVRASLPCAFDWRRRHSAGRMRSRFGCKVVSKSSSSDQAVMRNECEANAWTKCEGEEEPEEMDQELHNQEDDNESEAGSNQNNAAEEDDQSEENAQYDADSRMMQYDLESVTKAQRLLSLGLSAAARRIISPRSRFQMGEDDDSFMNIRSPVVMRASSSAGGTPTPVSTSSPAFKTCRRSEPEPKTRSIGWADDHFTLYHEVLGFLETACASASPHVSITSDRLAQMQQLLQALHPAAAAAIEPIKHTS